MKTPKTKYINIESLIYEREDLKKILLSKKIENNRCWEWSGFINAKGYGVFRHKSLSVNSHRVSYIIFNGSIEDDLYVLHKCDNRKCFNPKHLFKGTQDDNMKDMVNKGRSAKLDRIGELNPNSKLSNDQVKEIINMYKEISAIKISKIFNVSRTQIHRIIKKGIKE